MKHYYINVESKDDITMPDDFVAKLPKKIVLFMSVQYVQGIYLARDQLEAAGKEVQLIQTRHTRFEGQIYGCNVEHFDTDAEAFVLIGDGMFHPLALLYNNDQPVHFWNPHTKEQQILTKKDIEDTEKRKRGALASFITAKKIGVLVTVKPGQSHLKKALELEQRYPDKEFFILCMNEVDPQKLIDFSFVEMYINTACPRLGYDDTTRFEKPVLSIGDLDGFLY